MLAQPRRIIVILVLRNPKPERNIYSLPQIQAWSQELRSVANGINDTDIQLADHFYNIHYVIGPDQAEEEFDPFALDADYLRTFGGTVEDIIVSLQIVLTNGQTYIAPTIWKNGLEDYLRELLTKLTQYLIFFK